MGTYLWSFVGVVAFLCLSFAAVAFSVVFIGPSAANTAHVAAHFLTAEYGALVGAVLGEVQMKDYLNMSNIAVGAVFAALVALVCVADIGLTNLREFIRRKSKSPSQEFIQANNPSYDRAMAKAATPKEPRKRM